MKQNNFETMQIEAWGRKHEVCIEAGNYVCDDSLALRLLEITRDGMEPYGSLTVFLVGYGGFKDFAFVDTNNIHGAEEMIAAYRLGEPTGNYGSSGFCRYPEYEFHYEELKKYCVNPAKLERSD